MTSPRLLAALLLAALPACAPPPPAPAEEPAAAAASGLVAACDEASIRAEVPPSASVFFDRAFSWVHAGAMYCQCVTSATSPYRADCSGFVSYVWDLAAPGHTTYSFAGGPWDDHQSYVIGWDELTPGDALNFPGNPSAGVGHVMLFAGWLDAGHTQFCSVEESSTGTPAHVSKHRLSDPGSWWGGTGTFGDIYLPMRLVGYTPTPPNQPPQGWIDAAGCDRVGGWAQDPDAPDQAIDVHVYFDGTPGEPSAKAIAVHAHEHRDDLCQAIGSCSHGYSLSTPRSLLDGQPHPVWAYGIDTAGGNNPALAGSPQTIQCDPPPIPAGVKRWIRSPEDLAAWRFDAFRDLFHEPDAAVAAVPPGPDLPATPAVVQADDGSPEVWLLDTGVRRHVIDPASLSAWRFDGTVAVKPAAEVYALPVGADLPAAPFVFIAPSDPRVFLLDVPALPPAVGEGGAPPTAGGGDDVSGGNSNGAGGGPAGHAISENDADQGGGCAVAGGAGGGGWVLALALVALGRRRRIR